MKTVIHYKKTFSITAFIWAFYFFSTAQNIPDAASVYPTGSTPAFLPSNFTSGIKVNYVRSTSPKTPVTSEANLQPEDYDLTKVKTQYFDGLGRAIQTVDHFATPQHNDLVSVTTYDNLGRDAWHFLPYSKTESAASDNGKFKLTAYSDQKNFYKYTLGYTSDNYFYTQTDYEASPLNRVIKALPQGSSWVGANRGTTITENPLPAGAGVRVFTIYYTPGSLPDQNGTYAAGDLMVRTTTDEDGYFTEEYTTKDNLLVLKATGKTGNPAKLLTYYVYDDFGLLRFVIPPKATAWLAANYWNFPNQSTANGLCFSYEYDGRSRLIHKTLPGAGEEWMVYNPKDELIFKQTPNGSNMAAWEFYKYDVLGRLIQSGEYYDYHVNPSQATMQNYANGGYTGSDPFMQYMFSDVYGTASYVNTFTYAKVYTTNY
ncbi:MAG TPA: DUF6443 domain-containing protein, partial [Bacteroidia bacterium]|nr:DUF6443 domain-containing protein [Bacteroidia bacterium]